MDKKLIVLNKPITIQLHTLSYAFAFAIPLFVKHPQVLVGTAVNFLLFMMSSSLSKKQLIPLIMLPSISIVLHGVLFGPFTALLLYLMPFIWLGNAMLIYFFRVLEKRIPAIFRIIIASGLKAMFLFSCAFVLYQLNILPLIFLTTMGIVQFGTAFAGGTIFLLLNRLNILKIHKK